MDMDQRMGEMEFSLYDRHANPLVEGVTQFKYIGRTLKNTENY